MKRSALFHHHRRSGATFAACHGWELPAHYSAAEAEAQHVAESAGLADVSHRRKWECRLRPESNGWRLSDDRYLVVGEPPIEAPAAAMELTSIYANLLLAGPRSREILGKLTSLNVSEQRLPNGSCAQASVAHVHCIVLRDDLPRVPAYHLLVTRDYAESFWESVMHAGHEFSLQPFGWEALQRLRG